MIWHHYMCVWWTKTSWKNLKSPIIFRIFDTQLELHNGIRVDVIASVNVIIYIRSMYFINIVVFDHILTFIHYLKSIFYLYSDKQTFVREIKIHGPVIKGSVQEWHEVIKVRNSLFQLNFFFNSLEKRLRDQFNLINLQWYCIRVKIGNKRVWVFLDDFIKLLVYLQ